MAGRGGPRKRPGAREKRRENVRSEKSISQSEVEPSPVWASDTVTGLVFPPAKFSRFFPRGFNIYFFPLIHPTQNSPIWGSAVTH